MSPINKTCIQASDLGTCLLLIDPDLHLCINGECPFYKTRYDLAISNRDSEIRCNRKGITFISREDVLISESKSGRYTKSERRSDIAKGVTPKKVKQFNEAGEVVCIWDSVTDIVMNLGYSAPSIRRACQNGQKGHGHFWSYVR